MLIDEALKLSDIAITLNGGCVCRIKDADWYCHNTEGAASLHELKDLFVTKKWILSAREFCTSDTVTIVADPSQEQPEPEKRQRTHAEILADIKTLVSELEGAK